MATPHKQKKALERRKAIKKATNIRRNNKGRGQYISLADGSGILLKKRSKTTAPKQ